MASTFESGIFMQSWSLVTEVTEVWSDTWDVMKWKSKTLLLGPGLLQRSTKRMFTALIYIIGFLSLRLNNQEFVWRCFHSFMIATDFKYGHIYLPKCLNSSLNTKGPLKMSGWNFTNTRNSSDKAQVQALIQSGLRYQALDVPLSK